MSKPLKRIRFRGSVYERTTDRWKELDARLRELNVTEKMADHLRHMALGGTWLPETKTLAALERHGLVEVEISMTDKGREAVDIHSEMLRLARSASTRAAARIDPSALTPEQSSVLKGVEGAAKQAGGDGIAYDRSSVDDLPGRMAFHLATDLSIEPDDRLDVLARFHYADGEFIGVELLPVIDGVSSQYTLIGRFEPDGDLEGLARHAVTRWIQGVLKR